MVYLTTSEDVKQSHAAAIESHIEKYVGLDLDGGYRDQETRWVVCILLEH